MGDDDTHPADLPDPDPNRDNADDPQGSQSEQVRMQHISARVPENLGSGVFSTGIIAMTGANEFVLDFLQCVGRPRQVAARVVIPHMTLPQFLDALRKNLELYEQRFGTPPPLPRPNPARRPSVQEIYDDLKLPDEVLSGAYANGVMISHSASEFSLDFLTNFFPHSAVSCRVFLSAPQVPRMLETLTATYQQFQQRQKKKQGQAPPDQGSENPPPVVPPDEPVG